MENLAHWDRKTLINELVQGRELAKQLQIHLNVPYSSHEAREIVVQKIIRSYEKALSVLKSNGSGVGTSESPRSFSGSPCSEDSDRGLMDQENKDVCRKRKSLVSRWTQQVQVFPGREVEGALDDGYSWRKYGQKDILGAIYPRGYYRCANRNVKGCLATKQIQRLDVDPTIFEITYMGSHSCNQNSHIVVPPPPENQQSNTVQEYHQPIQQKYSQEIRLNFQTGLKVVTEDSENFSSNPDIPKADNNLMRSFSSSFVSPSTSASNYFYGGNYMNSQTRESDFTELISAADLEIDPTFTFDNLGFFF